jgi:sigma-B regulation protein RsbU (phosphoserine phosphatase)
MFVTALVAVLDHKTGHVEYVNAGHNPPLLLHDGKWDWLKDVSGMPLGLFDGIPYDLYALRLEPDDVIYAYTDGVTEAMNGAEQEFGAERLDNILSGLASNSSQQIVEAVKAGVRDFVDGAEQSDDITMLVLKRK